MKTFLSILFSIQATQAADFCTVVVSENFQEFNKIYRVQVKNYSCTNTATFTFKEERHINVNDWADGHSRFFPIFSSNLLKTMNDGGWAFKTSNNRGNSTNFFFHKK